MEKLKIGLVGTSQLSFPGDKEAAFNHSKEGMIKLAEKMGFELVTYDQTVITEADARVAVAYFEEQKVDFLLVQHTSYSSGFLSLVFAKIKNARLGYWAIPEGVNEGIVPFNSLCSINMHQAIVYHYLKADKVRLKWFYGDVEDARFQRRLEITVRALRAIKGLCNSRVALIGGIAPGFNDLYNDERQFLKLFDGMVYNRLHEYDEVKAIAMSMDDALVEKTASEMLACSCGANAFAQDKLAISARFYLAYKEFLKRYQYDALAVSCWPKFQDDYKYSVCSVVGQLNDEGTPTGCEGDILSTICMLALKYMTDDVTALMDMSAFDEEDESVLLWHCGPAGARFSKNYSLSANYSGMAHIKGQPPLGCGVARDMVFDEMDATVFRLTGECDKFMVLSGHIQKPGKPSLTGSRGWLENLKFNGESIGALDLINTIQTNGFQHHFPMVPGDFTQEVKEFAAWLGLRHIQKVAYEDCLQIID